MPNPYAKARSTAMPPLRFDAELIQTYNTAAPRYTSYPTALELAPIEDTLEADILQQREAHTPLSLYFHIPFCRHLCYYCACNKIITKKNSDSGDYLHYLLKEIDYKRRLLTAPNGTDKPMVKQLHLGGGTPTFLSDDEMVRLWEYLQTQFEFVDDKEGDYSIEIDPRELGAHTLATLRRLGFNRISLGVQDLADDVQIAVNRVHDAEQIEAIIQEARNLGFRSINIDLIYGLPKRPPQCSARLRVLSRCRPTAYRYLITRICLSVLRRKSKLRIPTCPSLVTSWPSLATPLTSSARRAISTLVSTILPSLMTVWRSHNARANCTATFKATP